jgi:hypothetical protein
LWYGATYSKIDSSFSNTTDALDGDSMTLGAWPVPFVKESSLSSVDVEESETGDPSVEDGVWGVRGAVMVFAVSGVTIVRRERKTKEDESSVACTTFWISSAVGKLPFLYHTAHLLDTKKEA